MKRKNLKVVVTLLLIIEISTIFLIYKSYSLKDQTLDDVKLVEKENKKMFAIMLEEKSGKYKESTENTWPDKGYVYNKEKSGCVDANGEKIEGILSFDEEKKMATVDTGKTSYCYLYFDKDVSYFKPFVQIPNYFNNANYAKNIYFVDYINTEGAIETKDVSEAQDGSIIGWITNTYDLYIGSEKTIKFRTMSQMFIAMENLETIEFNNIDTSEVGDMEETFVYCANLTTIKGLENFDTSNVTYMRGTFAGCSSLTTLDLSGWDTSNVTYIIDMFHGCKSLTYLDMRSATFTQIPNGGSYLFDRNSVPNNIEIIVKEDQVDWMRERLNVAIGEGNGTVRTP